MINAGFFQTKGFEMNDPRAHYERRCCLATAITMTAVILSSMAADSRSDELRLTATQDANAAVSEANLSPETLFIGKVEDTEFESTLDGLKFTVRYSPETKSLRVVTADSGLNWMYSLWFARAAFHPQADIQTLP